MQTPYDLRYQGRGPRGFRVGRELRFRVSELDAWIARMEADDAARHPEAPAGATNARNGALRRVAYAVEHTCASQSMSLARGGRGGRIRRRRATRTSVRWPRR